MSEPKAELKRYQAQFPDGLWKSVYKVGDADTLLASKDKVIDQLRTDLWTANQYAEELSLILKEKDEMYKTAIAEICKQDKVIAELKEIIHEVTTNCLALLDRLEKRYATDYKEEDLVVTDELERLKKETENGTL